MKLSEKPRLIPLLGWALLGMVFVLGATFQTIWVGKFYGDGSNLTNVTSTSVSTNTAALIATNDPWGFPLSNKVAVVVTGGFVTATTNAELMTITSPNPTNNDTVVSNGVYGLFNGGTNTIAGYARTLSAADTNNDTVVSNGVFSLLNTGTNDAFTYARATVGVGATNQDLKTSNTLWLKITNYYAAPSTGMTIATNVNGQDVVFTFTSSAGGSGTGIQTNSGTGTNNIFTAPILQGAIGSVDSNILYVVYGITNWVFRTNGDLVNLGSGKIFSLMSGSADTNAAGSGVAFLDDLNSASNTAYAYARTIGAAATNQDLKTSNTLWLDITNVYIAPGANVTVTTNVSGQSALYTIAGAGGGGGTAGTTNATLWNNSSGSTQIRNTNAPQATLTTWTESQMTVQTNFLHDGNGGATMQEVSYGLTNGFMNTFNAISFGANPASANNTTAIQNALNAASAVGGTVYLPPATNAYTFTGTLTIPSGVTLQGAGTVQSSKGSYLYNSSAGTLIVLSNTAVMKGLQINGGGVGAGQIGITTSLDPANPSTEYLIQGNTIKNLTYGIMASNSWTAVIRDNDIGSCIVGVTFTNYANAIVIEGGHIGNCIVGVDVRGDVTPQINNISIFSTIEACSNNVRLVGANWANINLSGHHYSEGSTNAVYAGAGQNLNIDHFAFMATAGASSTNIVLRGTKGVNIDHSYFFNSVAFDADASTFGLSFEKNRVESAVTWNNRAITYTIGDNTNVVSTFAYTVGGISNTGPTYMNGTETNSTITSGMVLADNNGKRYSSTAPTNDLLLTVMAGGVKFTNLVVALNTNLPGAAFKVIGSNGGNAAYVTNLTGNVTLAAFDLTGARSDSVFSFFVHAVADSSSRTVTMPSGVVYSGYALPVAIVVTNAQSANFQFYGIQGQWTNMSWIPIY